MKDKRQLNIFYSSLFRLGMSYVLVWLLIFQLTATAQTDSLRYSTETHYDSVVEYLTPMEYAFMMHEETNWLLKANLLVTSENYLTNTFKLSLEKKIADGFSLNVAAQYWASNFDAVWWGYGMELSIESRWYYDYRNNVRNKQAAAHLSGAYLALGGGYRYTDANVNIWEKPSSFSYVPLFAKWGLQKRFLNHGYVDFGLSAGTQLALSDGLPSIISIGTYVDGGLAFTRDKEKLDFEKLCPVLKCHAADKFLLKTNFVDIVSLEYVRKTFIGSVLPNISAEFKLGESPFSINAKLSSRLEYANTFAYDYNYFTVSPQFHVEGRYYYNLKRRMLKGKSGNGLSANYISVGPLFNGEYTTFHTRGDRADRSISFVGMNLSTGIQRLIGDHLFFDFNTGLSYGMEYNYDEAHSVTYEKDKFIFNLTVAIGYRF